MAPINRNFSRQDPVPLAANSKQDLLRAIAKLIRYAPDHKLKNNGSGKLVALESLPGDVQTLANKDSEANLLQELIESVFGDLETKTNGILNPTPGLYYKTFLMKLKGCLEAGDEV